MLNDDELMELWNLLKNDSTLAPASHMHNLPNPLTLSKDDAE
jgi:hypothetical protein